MASTIQALSSGSGGLVSSGDASGILQIQTGSGPTTAINIDASQVVTINGLTVGKGGGAVGTNTALGTSALSTNSTGSANTAVGDNALTSNSTGTDNSAFGLNALNKNTASYNSAFGVSSLYANTSGTFNTGYGWNSLPANTTGNYNVAVGPYSLNANTTSSNNTAVGYQAGYAGTTAALGTFLGYQAGNAVTTGSNNVVLGGASGATLTTGNNNTLVGQNVDVAAAANINCIVIGATGSGSVGKGSSTGYINAGGGGIYQGNNSASWSTTSDQRIKENIVAIPSGLAIIGKLNPVTFDYIETKKSDTGFIAQEYQKVLPDQVTEHAASPAEKEIAGTDTLLGITPNLVPYLVKAIQELSAQVTALQAQVTALQGAK